MDNLKNLTEREREVFDYIRSTIRDKGYAPSVRDICNACEIRSTSTVYNYLLRLEEKGVISKAPGKSRTLRIAEKNVTRAVRVPVLGKVAAGMPILALENCTGSIEVPNIKASIDPDELFALTVQGESMIEAGILDGDLIVVEKCSTAREGEIVVAMVDGEATVKTFARDGDKIVLIPANSAMSPIYVDEAIILGRLISSVRFYNNSGN